MHWRIFWKQYHHLDNLHSHHHHHHSHHRRHREIPLFHCSRWISADLALQWLLYLWLLLITAKTIAAHQQHYNTSFSFYLFIIITQRAHYAIVSYKILLLEKSPSQFHQSSSPIITIIIIIVLYYESFPLGKISLASSPYQVQLVLIYWNLLVALHHPQKLITATKQQHLPRAKTIQSNTAKSIGTNIAKTI